MPTDKKLIEQAVTGNPPIWCDHIQFWSRPAGEVDGLEYEAQGGWSLVNSGAISLYLHKWKFCPICGIENPYTPSGEKIARSGDAIEHDIMANLKAAWSDFCILRQNHPQHAEQFLKGIHECQQVIMWRELQRLKPEKYPIYDSPSLIDEIGKR